MGLPGALRRKGAPRGRDASRHVVHAVPLQGAPMWEVGPHTTGALTVSWGPQKGAPSSSVCWGPPAGHLTRQGRRTATHLLTLRGFGAVLLLCLCANGAPILLTSPFRRTAAPYKPRCDASRMHQTPPGQEAAAATTVTLQAVYCTSCNCSVQLLLWTFNCNSSSTSSSSNSSGGSTIRCTSY